MLTSHEAQFFKIQLKWAADNFDAEHRLRLAADQRAVAARSLLMELAMHLLASELDDVIKQQDVTKWTDVQLVQWMKDLLGRYLWQWRASTGEAGRRRLEQAAQEIRRLQAENAQLNEQNFAMQAEAKRVATDQATITDQRHQIERLQQELADSRDDLEIARSQASRPAEPRPVIIDMPIVAEPDVRPRSTASPSSKSTTERSTLDWYVLWQDSTAPEAFESRFAGTPKRYNPRPDRRGPTPRPGHSPELADKETHVFDSTFLTHRSHALGGDAANGGGRASTGPADSSRQTCAGGIARGDAVSLAMRC